MVFRIIDILIIKTIFSMQDTIAVAGFIVLSSSSSASRDGEHCLFLKAFEDFKSTVYVSMYLLVSSYYGFNDLGDGIEVVFL